MDLNVKLNHKVLYAIAGFFILASLIALFSFLLLYKNKNNLRAIETKSQVENITINGVQGQDAESLAQEVAKKWRSDAVLAYMKSDVTVGRGTESWRLVYISPVLKNFGYEIIIKDGQIFSTKEINYFGQGDNFPTDSKITQEQAIERVKNMPGFKDAEILTIDAVYGPGTKTWYWGIKTSKGIVSVEMK